MEKFFEIRKNGSTPRTEVIAGCTTFFTMSYILFVNPSILSVTGMNPTGVFVATVLAAVIGTLVMGIFAKVPFAVAPGMGMNALFAFTVCLGLGFAWQEALAVVFLCGIVNLVCTLTKVRKQLIQSIPKFLQLAIAGGIGVFIAYIGLVNSNIIDLSGSVPALTHFKGPEPVLAVIGLVLTVVMMILKIKGFLFIGIIITTLIGIPMGVTNFEPNQASIFESWTQVSFAFFGDVGFASLLAPEKLFMSLVLILAFSLTDTFDTIGTFLGVGRRSGIFDNEDEQKLFNSTGFKSKMDKALFADATATSVGALLGTSNTTCYVESAAGVSEGGKTGLVSVVVAALFLLCLPFAGIFTAVPFAATAPALVVVGVMMCASLKEIDWGNISEAIPVFLTLTVMAFSYNISYGIAAGFIFHVIIKITKREAKDLHPILIGAVVLFLLHFATLPFVG
jgi:AGZA family xanthine/uracil permease-like MFS transporter